MKKYNLELHNDLKKLYIYQGKSLIESAAQLGISVVTARNWKKKAKIEHNDDWDKLRNIARMGTGEFSAQLLEDFALFSQGVRDKLQTDATLSPLERVQAMASIADSFAKMARGIDRVNPKISELSIVNKILKLQEQFIIENYPHHLQPFTEIIEPFGNYIIEHHFKK